MFLFEGNRLAKAQGRDVGGLEEETEGRRYQFISEVLRWRAHSTPDHELFTLLNAKGTVSQSMTCSQLHKKAERIACLLIEKGRLNTGNRMYPLQFDRIF